MVLGELAMKNEVVAVIGGAGFVGRNVVRELCKRGARVVVGCRDTESAKFLRSMGDIGQVNLIKVNIANYDQMSRALEGADHVVSLVGILNETRGNTFETAQANGPLIVGKIAREKGIKSLVHISAIGADIKSKSLYASSKGLGESHIRDEFEKTTILRPSIIFGPDDNFFNRFANLAAFAPVLPLIGGGKTKFQPVYVQDVASAIMVAIEDSSKAGKNFELGGPSIYSFRELLELLASHTLRKRKLISIPFSLARIQANVLELLPNPPLTRDQVELLKTDNVVSEEALTFQDLNISPVSCEVILPTYLDRFKPGGRYNRSRINTQS